MSKIDKAPILYVSRQCELLNVLRSIFYYSPLEDGFFNEELMKQSDKQYKDIIFSIFSLPVRKTSLHL